MKTTSIVPMPMILEDLEVGMLRSAPKDGPLAYRMALLREEDLPSMLALHRTVVDTLEEWDLLVPITPEELRIDLGERGATIGTFVGDELVGFRSIHFPGNGKDNLGRDLGFPESELVRVMHLEFTMVDPRYRGNSLQKRMTKRLLRAIADLGLGYRYLCSFVSPKNAASMADKFALDMLVGALLPKCETYMRFVFFQDVVEPLVADPNTVVTAHNRDWDRIGALLSSGLFAYRQTRADNGSELSFARCQRAGSG